MAKKLMIIFIIVIGLIISCKEKQKEKVFSMTVTDSIKVYLAMNNEDQEISPRAAAINTNTDEILIFDRYSNSFLFFDLNNFKNRSLIKKQIHINKGNAPGELVLIEDIEYDSHRNIYYVSDTEGMKISIFDTDLREIKRIKTEIRPSHLFLSNQYLFVSNNFSAHEKGNVLRVDLDTYDMKYFIDTMEYTGSNQSSLTDFYFNMSFIVPLEDDMEKHLELRMYPDFSIKMCENDTVIKRLFPPNMEKVLCPTPEVYEYNGQRRFKSMFPYSDVRYDKDDNIIILKTCSGYHREFSEKHGSQMIIFNSDGDLLGNLELNKFQTAQNKIIYDSSRDMVYLTGYGVLCCYQINGL